MRGSAGYVISLMPPKRSRQPLTKEPSLIAMDDRWATGDQVQLGAVWFQFLMISPSYELARKERSGRLTAADRERLPADFDAVLSVYDDLGDVQRQQFEEWWLTNGIKHYGYEGHRPIIHPIHVLLSEQSDPMHRAAARLQNYIDGPWNDQGCQTSFIIAIPTGLPKNEIIDQVANLIDGVPQAHKYKLNLKAKYIVEGKKYDIQSYFRYLKCMYIRAEFPATKLWEIGALAELSTTYSARITKGAGSAEDQQALKMLASRALYRGLMMAENAARGVFPSYGKCPHAIPPEWADLDALIADRLAWEDENE
jgi:hypothetical protein